MIPEFTLPKITHYPKQQGTVKWFDEGKGFGFIIPAVQPNPDVFVHISDVRDCNLRYLTKDTLVEFHVVDNSGRPKAVNIKVVTR